jgi:hypothetical protein
VVVILKEYLCLFEMLEMVISLSKRVDVFVVVEVLLVLLRKLMVCFLGTVPL